MQASNLTPMDEKDFKDLFSKIKERNPKAIFHTFQKGKFKKKDCLFKDKCKP